MATIAKSEFRKRIIVFMKPSSTMVARAAKPIALAASYVMRANIAGATVIVGGTKTAIGGAPSAIGMTTIMIATIATIRPVNLSHFLGQSLRGAVA